MSIQNHILGAFLGTALLVPATASAIIVTETITFDSLSAGTTVGSGFSFGAFQYTNVGGFGGNQRAVAVPGGIAMADFDRNDFNGAAAGLSRVGGGIFDVLSIDIADLTNNSGGGGGTGGLSGSGFRIGLQTNLGGSTQSFSPTSSTFSTVSLAGDTGYTGASDFFVNIVSQGSFDNFAIDNIVVRYDNGVPAPAPATALLAGAGLLFLGLRRRYA